MVAMFREPAWPAWQPCLHPPTLRPHVLPLPDRLRLGADEHDDIREWVDYHVALGKRWGAARALCVCTRSMLRLCCATGVVTLGL